MAVNDDIAKCLDSDRINESSINRVKRWFEEKECACISACRESLKNVTENTFIGDKEIGDFFTKKENQERNKELKAILRKYGYGVTSQDGIYVERDSNKRSGGKEVSFLVVNLNDDPDFFKKLFELSEHFNQDSFLYKKPNEEEAFFIGTNSCDDPGFGERKSAGTFYPIADEGFLSKIGSKSYQFRKKFNKGIEESIEHALEISTFKNESLNTKALIDQIFELSSFLKFKKERT